MARPGQLIGIGEFARRVRLSVKQLRSYDELALLAPAYVDPDSGYRYYHRGQARTAITIALLRTLDVPLADVHELLVADKLRSVALLERQRTRIEREVEQGRRTLLSLERLLASDDLLPYDVAEREEPARALVGLRGACEAESLGGAAPALVHALVEAIPAVGEADGAPVVGLYPLELEGTIEFFVGVEESAATHSRRGTERIELAAARFAVTTHVGSFDELQLAYFPLLAYAHERGLLPAQFVLETYLDDPAVVPPERLRTEVALALGTQLTGAIEPFRPTQEASL